MMGTCKECGKRPKRPKSALCKECHKAYCREYYRKNREKIKRQNAEYRESVKHTEQYQRRVKEYHRKRHLDLKVAALNKYGRKCACCGESQFEFLTLDHVNNDGHIHRREINQRNFYEWLKNMDYPDDYELQTLCFNCNFGKRYNGGVCPHVTEGSETIPSGSTP